MVIVLGLSQCRKRNGINSGNKLTHATSNRAMTLSERDCLYCQKDISHRNRNALYCNLKCSELYQSDKAKRKHESYQRKGFNCKYCKNSDHTGYCCPEHKKWYQQISQNIKIAKSKPKRKPTEAQKKSFRKIETFLNRPI